MSQTDQPNPRNRRGGRPTGRNASNHQNRSRNPRQRSRHDAADRTPREDHRDWEPVDRGRDIRRRAAEQPGFLKKWLSILTFGLLGGLKKSAAKPVSVSPRASGGKSSGRGDRESRDARPARTSPREPRPVLPPNPDAVTSPRLHVGNLNYDAAESDLTELFNGVGQVQSVEVVYHRDTQRSKGFAFVQLLTIEEAKRAVVELHGKEYMGRKMEIGPARSPGERRRD